MVDGGGASALRSPSTIAAILMVHRFHRFTQILNANNAHQRVDPSYALRAPAGGSSELILLRSA